MIISPSAPPRLKSNTVNTIVEEVIKKHESEFEERKIKIIKKQFDRDLPEAILPDEQLRYVLTSVIECVLLSIPPEWEHRIFDKTIRYGGIKG